MTVVPMLRNPALGQNSNWTLLLLADEGNRAEDKEKEQSFCSSDSVSLPIWSGEIILLHTQRSIFYANIELTCCLSANEQHALVL